MTNIRCPGCRRHVAGLVLAAVLASQALVAAPALSVEAGLSKEEEAAALSVVAKKKADDGEFAVAAELYLQAWQTFPKEPGYLYSAARCFHKGGRWDEAEKRYDEFVRTAPSDHPSHSKALGYRDEVRKVRSDEKVRQQAIERLQQEQARLAEERRRLQLQQAEAKKAQDVQREAAREAQLRAAADLRARQGEGRTAAGWSLVGVGALAGGLGGWMLWSGLAEAEALRGDLALVDAKTGKIIGITHREAEAARASALRSQAIGGTALGLGALAASAGVWLLLDRGKDRAASLSVTPVGLALALRF